MFKPIAIYFTCEIFPLANVGESCEHQLQTQ